MLKGFLFPFIATDNINPDEVPGGEDQEDFPEILSKGKNITVDQGAPIILPCSTNKPSTGMY